MKTLKYILEASSEVKNRKLKQLLAKEGLDKIILCKGYGYFYIASDDDEWATKLTGMYENAIYINSFNQQSPEEWVEDIKRLLKQNNIEY
jgi:hypothetical protein